MPQTVKNTNKKQNITTATQQLGLALMSLATVVGLVEMPDRPLKVAVLAPAYAAVFNHNSDVNPLRREREESGPHFISYSASQRTPGRTGRI